MIAFYNKMTISAEKGRAVDVIYINFSKAFGTVFYFLRSFLTWTILWRYETGDYIGWECLSFKACSLSAPQCVKIQFAFGLQ